MAVLQHHGRPHTPTDQAWIETLFGHVKHEWPHLETITDPAMLDTELARVRDDYNGVRLHQGISATSPPTTNTKAAAKPSAKHAPRVSGEPTTSASTTIAGPPRTTPRRPHELDFFQPDLRGQVRHTS